MLSQPVQAAITKQSVQFIKIISFLTALEGKSEITVLAGSAWQLLLPGSQTGPSFFSLSSRRRVMWGLFHKNIYPITECSTFHDLSTSTMTSFSYHDLNMGVGAKYSDHCILPLFPPKNLCSYHMENIFILSQSINSKV